MAFHVTEHYDNGYPCGCCRQSWEYDIWYDTLEEAVASIPDYGKNDSFSNLNSIDIIDGSTGEKVAGAFWTDKRSVWHGYTPDYSFEHRKESLKVPAGYYGLTPIASDKTYTRIYGTRTVSSTDEKAPYECIYDPEGEIVALTWDEVKKKLIRQKAEQDLAWAAELEAKASNLRTKSEDALRNLASKRA